MRSLFLVLCGLLLINKDIVAAENVATAQAEILDVKDLRIRWRVSDSTTLGKPAPEEFEAYDIAGQFYLPWLRYPIGSWSTGTRLMVSGGWISGQDNSALIVSAIPLLTLTSENERVVFDAGAGAAFMNRQQFGEQDFGGLFQFGLTVGIRFPIYDNFGVGYRFQHYSDAGIHSNTSIGADFHMVELSYQF